MNTAQRAAIASATIFPGAGLFLLRQYVRGLIFSVPALIIVAMLFMNMLKVSSRISDQLAQQEIPFDVVAIGQQLHLAIFDSPYWQEGKWILLASWLLSIISSYYAGKKIDLQNATSSIK
jgi:hypothetical protein